jgi:hypothetical protein
MSDDHGTQPPPVCAGCPICTGLSALRHARPEAVDHLLKAGAELLLAARALLEAAAPDGAQDRPATEGMQRIDVG